MEGWDEGGFEGHLFVFYCLKTKTPGEEIRATGCAPSGVLAEATPLLDASGHCFATTQG